ncbi:MAG: elongation factor G [Deltaproteobacteria bacterium]
MEVKDKRSVILLGHAQVGKTSLCEAMLFKCGATTRKGTTAEGNTVSDYNFDEVERKSSINASFMFCEYDHTRIQIVDTPGFADFYGEVLSSIRAADNAIVVVDGGQGVEIGTEKAWELLEEAKMPRIIFVNKIDKEDFDREKVLSDIKKNLSKNAVVLASGSLDELAEAVAESDDKLTEKYLTEGTLTSEEIREALPKAVDAGKVFPILFGSATADKGIDELLKAVKDDLASPLEFCHMQMGQGEVTASDASPFTGFVFKSIFDPYVGQLSLVKVLSGRLATNTSFFNVSQQTNERFGQIMLLQGKEQRVQEGASCGDIIAIPKLKETKTNDTIGAAGSKALFKPIAFPESMMSASVKPKTRQDEEKITQALQKLVAEDPTFREKVDPETKEMVISGLGDLHLHVMIGRLKKRFNVDVELGTPKVPYKETISKGGIKVQGKYKRQSGGRGQYGDCWIEIWPLEHGKGFEFEDNVVGGAIPRNFIPSVEKGIINTMTRGVFAGYPMVDIKVSLYDGSYHDVDSSDAAFQRAGSLALKKAVALAGPVLLEPIMDVDVLVTEEFLGQVSGDLNQRRGRPMGMEAKGKLQVVKAHVPLSEMFTYASDLRSMTQGKGSFTMHFAHYEQVPAKIAQPIIAKYQAQHAGEAEE